MLKKGQEVKLVQPIIQGKIIKLNIVDDVVQYLVEYKDAEGNGQERYFTEEQLEVVL